MGVTDWGKLGLVLVGEAMLSKSLIQFSTDGQCCVPSLQFGLYVFSGYTITNPQLRALVVIQTLSQLSHLLRRPPMQTVSLGETNLTYLYHRRYFCKLEQGAQRSQTPRLLQQLRDAAILPLIFAFQRESSQVLQVIFQSCETFERLLQPFKRFTFI